MNIIIGQERLSFTEKQLEKMYLDEGNEEIVYHYKNKVLKIYKSISRKDRLDEATTEKLTQLSTKRILLPEEIIYDYFSFSFQGYTTSFIDELSLEEIEDMKMDIFVDNMDLIYDDGELLAENGFRVDDLVRNNLVFNKNIYFVDPGSLIWTNENSQKWNQNKINEMILCDLFIPISYKTDSMKNTRGMLREIPKREEYQEGRINRFIENTMDEKETVKKYIKRMNQTWNT